MMNIGSDCEPDKPLMLFGSLRNYTTSRFSLLTTTPAPALLAKSLGHDRLLPFFCNVARFSRMEMYFLRPGLEDLKNPLALCLGASNLYTDTDGCFSLPWDDDVGLLGSLEGLALLFELLPLLPWELRTRVCPTCHPPTVGPWHIVSVCPPSSNRITFRLGVVLTACWKCEKPTLGDASVRQPTRIMGRAVAYRKAASVARAAPKEYPEKDTSQKGFS